VMKAFFFSELFFLLFRQRHWLWAYYCSTQLSIWKCYILWTYNFGTWNFQCQLIIWRLGWSCPLKCGIDHLQGFKAVQCPNVHKVVNILFYTGWWRRKLAFQLTWLFSSY
jgi:hypothetical protein